jgi:lipoprotein-anchoring transpeptidase ErfK/SrfK
LRVGDARGEQRQRHTRCHDKSGTDDAHVHVWVWVKCHTLEPANAARVEQGHFPTSRFMETSLFRSPLRVFSLLFVLAACSPSETPVPDVAQTKSNSPNDNRVSDSMAQTPPDLSARDTAPLRVEVDLAARQLRVLEGANDTVVSHPVAVGSEEWPTRTGSWTIGQVVLNPEWIPPDESWAEEREGRQPGDPSNPLGKAQLVYDLPRSIHGTNAPASIGKAVSHGSIRVANDVALSLAQLLIERTGAGDAPALLASAKRDSSQKIVLDLPRLVPIRVY